MCKLVSIIICTFNRKDLVPRAIDSALNQKDINSEVIIVDDASTDGTSDYIRKNYGSQITVCRLENNAGVSQATNYGYRYAGGHFIALLGDDDYWIDDHKLTKQLAIIEKSKRIGFVGSWRIIRHPDRDVEDRFIAPQSRRVLVKKVLSGGCVGGSTPLIRREAWDCVSGMDPNQKKGTDSDLFRRIILGGYNMDVLREIAVVSDKSHGLERMTPVKTSSQARLALEAHCYVVKKLWRYYLLHPTALVVRLRRMGALMGKCISKK